MFNDNLVRIRKAKGFTQEELAVRLNVVRQTVSKWEKGLSVPDAITLKKIAEELDVEVNQLLGATSDSKIMDEENEIAVQLARINEQLAVKNQRAKKIWRTIGIIILVIAAFLIITIFLSLASFETVPGETKTNAISSEELHSE